jgi:hypothetical protein
MYILHFGVLGTSATIGIRFEDEALGKLVIAGKQDEGEHISLQTAGGGSYTATVETDTWRHWGKIGNPNRLGAHITVALNHWPTPREVLHLRMALREQTLVGRMCDWARLTNAENWEQTVKFYLFEANESGVPLEVEPASS